MIHEYKDGKWVEATPIPYQHNIIKKCWRHFKIITKHKWAVFKECAACGLIWQGIIHDLSKYGPTEFIASAKHFQGDRSPIDAEKEELGYSLAWNHHKGHNPHHWEYWIDFDENGDIIVQRIPFKYVVEMVCDWVAAGKVYNPENWSNAEPYNYYMKVRKGRHFHPVTEQHILTCLRIIRDAGLDEFHRILRGGKREVD